MSLFEQINNGIKEAMRNREQLRLEVLRMLKSKILAVNARGDLSDTEIVKLFKTYFGNLQEAYEQALAVSRHDMSDKLKQEMQVVLEFLPKAPSHHETEMIVKQAIHEASAKTKKDFGMVMKHIMKINSAVDGKLAKEIANKFLED